MKKYFNNEFNEASFTLLNHDGCVFDRVSAKSFISARKFFASKFQGKFKIYCEVEQTSINVRL